jgi:hypothetical protein
MKADSFCSVVENAYHDVLNPVGALPSDLFEKLEKAATRHKPRRLMNPSKEWGLDFDIFDDYPMASNCHDAVGKNFEKRSEPVDLRKRPDYTGGRRSGGAEPDGPGYTGGRRDGVEQPETPEYTGGRRDNPDYDGGRRDEGEQPETPEYTGGRRDNPDYDGGRRDEGEQPDTPEYDGGRRDGGEQPDSPEYTGG